MITTPDPPALPTASAERQPPAPAPLFTVPAVAEPGVPGAPVGNEHKRASHSCPCCAKTVAIL